MDDGNSEGSWLGADDADGKRLVEGTEDGETLMDGASDADGVSLGVLDGDVDGRAVFLLDSVLFDIAFFL
jgi:hypothetical protein